MPPLYAAQLAATIARVCRKQRLVLNAGMTPPELARCVEMAINGTKSAYPAMQPADAFLRDLEHHAAHAGRRRRLPATKSTAPLKSAKKPAPKSHPQIRRSQMSTMTINGRSPPCPTIPMRC